MKPLLLLLLIISVAKAQIVTIVSTNYGPEAPALTLESFQSAELLSFPAVSTTSQTLWIEKDGIRVVYSTAAPGGPSPFFKPLVVAGPAKIRVNNSDPVNAGNLLATFRLSPEPYPPDRAVIVSPGPGGANVTLQCSTNLVDWSSATNGVYTNEPVAKFFRIRLDKIPTLP